MASTIAQVIDGIEQRLATINGLRVFDYPPDAVSPPAAIVSLPSSIEFDTTLQRGADRLTLTVTVLVSVVTDRGARGKLSAFLDPSGARSVKAAVEGEDDTLGGVVHWVRVKAVSGIAVYTIAGIDMLGANFTIEAVF